MLRQYELVDLVKSYDPHADEGLLNRAYVFAMKAHGRQVRLSGDTYFSHPIEVAGILTKLRLDTETIATALLHDTIEDTDTTYGDIEGHFGQEIGELVEGVTKLSNIHFTDRQAKQAENFRKFFLATSKDVRVLLVKLADRLHNMRTIFHHPNEKKKRDIAQETLEIYAPLAGRIGMQGFREEFEDRCFSVLYPEARESVVKRLNYLNQESGDSIEKITNEIRSSLEENDICALVYGRQKRPYAVWRKMERKAVSFEQLSDIIGFRVIVDDKAQCYTALGVIHSRWKMVPNFFKDYISTPKRNGYQSIHTTVLGPDDQRVELQIRTKEMHAVAETGVAAHWDYKELTYMIGESAGKARDRDAALIASKKLRKTLFQDLRGLADLFDAEESSEIFLEHTKMEMYSDQVFAFTPKGDLINLPQGASVLDFAYAVHTTIGDTCVGAKINGRHRPLRARLQNGDSIEIICSNAQMPTPDSESFVVTGRARSAIRRRIRLARREEFMDLGRKMLESAWRKRDLTFAEGDLKTGLPVLNIPSTEELFVKVGSGSISIDVVVDAVFPGLGRPKTRWLDRRRPLSMLWPVRSTARETKSAIPIKGLQPGLALHFATCCHPLPGDQIVGISEPGEGMIVHRLGCKILTALDDEGLNLQWEPLAKNEATAIGQIVIMATNEIGVLGETATIIANHEGNITNVRIIGQDKRYAELEVDIAVRDVDHLEAIISALDDISPVNSVERSSRRAAVD